MGRNQLGEKQSSMREYYGKSNLGQGQNTDGKATHIS